jgi:hypothetical protein
MEEGGFTLLVLEHTDFVDGDDVRVGEFTRHAAFLKKSLHRGGSVIPGKHHLDGDLAPEIPVQSFTHLPQPPPAQFLKNGVPFLRAFAKCRPAWKEGGGSAADIGGRPIPRNGFRGQRGLPFLLRFGKGVHLQFQQGFLRLLSQVEGEERATDSVFH